MNPIKHSRAAGGHLVHARQYGNYTALCGFTPGKNEQPRQMQSRAGWNDLKAERCPVTCRKCKAEIADTPEARAAAVSPASLSPAMVAVMRDVAAGLGTHGSAWGRSQHGGRYATAGALRKRGLLDFANELTDAGRKILEIVNRRDGA